MLDEFDFFMNYFFARSKRWAVQIIFMTQVSKLDDWRIGDWARTATNWWRILIVSQNYVYQPNAGLYCPKKPLCLNPDTISVTQLCLKIYNCRIFTKLCIQYIDKGSWDFQVCTRSCLLSHKNKACTNHPFYLIHRANRQWKIKHDHAFVISWFSSFISR